MNWKRWRRTTPGAVQMPSLNRHQCSSKNLITRFTHKPTKDGTSVAYWHRLQKDSQLTTVKIYRNVVLLTVRFRILAQTSKGVNPSDRDFDSRGLLAGFKWHPHCFTLIHALKCLSIRLGACFNKNASAPWTRHHFESIGVECGPKRPPRCFQTDIRDTGTTSAEKISYKSWNVPMFGGSAWVFELSLWTE